MKLLAKAVPALAAVSMTLGAHAYESEKAVPLTVGGRLTNQPVADVAVRLDGNNVVISGTLANTSNSPLTYGFFAYTPLFLRYGEGEENYDKSFSDLTVSLDGQPVKVVGEQRGFFLGKDITSSLASAALSPLPSEEDDPKDVAKIPPQFGIKLTDGRDWQGFVSYSWVTTIRPASSGTLDVRYKALPQFGIEQVPSQRFSNLVQQHCGDPSLIAAQIEKMHSGTKAVLMEKYVVPVSFVNRDPVRLSISQPQTNSLGAHPMIALACGLSADAEKSLPASGVLQEPDDELSILLISTLASP
jgi:hypothetical protein